MSQYPAQEMSQAEEDQSRRYGSSESESKPPSASSSAPKKRASRAGTRSVSNLSAAQLERKRANDREAQRAIRQRTKDHIDTLERRVSDIQMNADQRERVLTATQARNRELEQENAFLRTRLGNDAYLMQIPNTDQKPADSAMGGSAQTSPQTRFTGGESSRPASQAQRGSVSGQSSASSARPEAWRQQSQPTVFSPSEPSATPAARPEPARAASWRNPTEIASSLQSHAQSGQVQMEQAHRSFSSHSGQERPSWASGSGYNYMVDPSQQPPGFSASRQPGNFPGPPPQAPYPIQSNLPPPTGQHPSYGAALTTPSTEFSNLSMQSPATQTPTHEQHPGHAPYDVSSSHMPGPPGYPGQQQQPQSAIPRTPLAPPYNQPPASSGYPQPGMTQGQHLPMEYHGPPGQQNYPYGQYHGSG